MSTSLPQIQPLASAIAQAEGFGVSNNVPTLANNPGDLELGDIGNGTIAAANGQQITIFGSLEDGWSALENQLNKIFSGTSSYYTPDQTLSQFGTTYSGGNQNYGSTLAKILGVSPSTPLSALNGTSNLNSGTSSPLFSSSNSSIGKLAGILGVDATAWPASRVLVLVLGVILFIAGLFSFKQTQDVVSSLKPSKPPSPPDTSAVGRQHLRDAIKAAKIKDAKTVVEIAS